MRRNHDASGAQDEMVVLVNEANEPLGLAPKSAVHTNETPLHRGFSAFIFDTEGKLLLQQRSASKVTWPLVWSNSVCGHPAEDESAEEAARRRLAHELGLTEVALLDVLPDFRYRAEQDGIVENELCPVLVGVTRQAPVPNPEEVASVEWVEWPVFVQGVESGEADVSPWCREETRLLASMPDLPGILLTLRNDLDEPDIS